MTTMTSAALAMAFLGTSLPAMATDITAANPKSIVDSLLASGYRATLEQDDMGDPKITSSASGAEFTIHFYGCTDGTACTSVLFQSGFDLADGGSPTNINTWNAENRYTRAYLDDENDPILEMDINLDEGGITDALFQSNTALWEGASGTFQTHIGW